MPELTMPYIFSQVSYTIGFFLVTFGKFTSTKKTIVLMTSISNLFYCLHYVFLGSLDGVILNISLMVGSLMLLYIESKPVTLKTKTCLRVILNFVYLISMIVTFVLTRSLPVLFPFVATLGYLNAAWSASPQGTRISLLVCDIAFALYGLTLRSIMACIIELIAVVTGVSAILVHKNDEEPKKQEVTIEKNNTKTSE